MTGARVLVGIAGLVLVLIVVGGCGARWTSDTDGISLLVVRQQDAALLPTLTISNTSSVSIEVSVVEDMIIYHKERDGWERWGPCSSAVFYYTEKQVIPPGGSWEILPTFYKPRTCRFLDNDSVGTYMASIRYCISGNPGSALPLTLYSSEFRMGEAEEIASFAVSVERPSFSGFRLHNRSDRPIWFNPPCSRVPNWFEEAPYIEAPHLLQRQTDADAWESFGPDERLCAETLEPIRIEAGGAADIEAEMASLGWPGPFPPGRYRWKIVFVLDRDENDELTATDAWWPFGRRHIFSPAFEYDGTNVTAVP